MCGASFTFLDPGILFLVPEFRRLVNGFRVPKALENTIRWTQRMYPVEQGFATPRRLSGHAASPTKVRGAERVVTGGFTAVCEPLRAPRFYPTST